MRLSLRVALCLAIAAVVAVAAGCGSSYSGPSSPAPSPSPSQSATSGTIQVAPGWGAVVAGDFGTTVDNPWFPLVEGYTWTSKGVKDGEPTVDVFAVTGRTKVIEGVTCTVVRDVTTVRGRPVEKTWDWYAQDKQGNVWYFGEDTAELDKAGKVITTEGSWQSGVDGAAPGIFMPADPAVGDGGYQEYYKGQALDRYEVASLNASITVPYGSFKHCLLTTETTALEPGIVDHKYYVRGIGQVAEETAKGPRETSLLVAFSK